MSQHFDARDKTIVITGGASGLGAAFVEAFLTKGAKRATVLRWVQRDTAEGSISDVAAMAIVILDVAEELGKATADRLNKIYGGKVTFMKCNVAKEDDITSAFEAVLSHFKQIDVLINNAGTMNDAPQFWRTSCEVNWQGSVSFTLKGINHMRQDKGGAGGTIINVSSTAALGRFGYFVPMYNGCKIAVLHFSQCISMKPFYEETNIRILTICFGPTDTPIMHNLETKCYDSEHGKKFVEAVETSSHIVVQKVDSAVAALVLMFETGGPGTIWLSRNNNPAKDITPTINRVFDELEKVVSSV